MHILTITLPIPPRVLNFNVHIRHWSQRSGPMKSYKQAAYYATLDAIARNREFRHALPLDRIDIIPTMYFPRAAKRDRDNWAEAFKAVQDGIERAGVILDDHTATMQQPIIEVDRDKPRVEVVIREIVIGSIALHRTFLQGETVQDAE